MIFISLMLASLLSAPSMILSNIEPKPFENIDKSAAFCARQVNPKTCAESLGVTSYGIKGEWLNLGFHKKPFNNRPSGTILSLYFNQDGTVEGLNATPKNIDFAAGLIRIAIEEFKTQGITDFKVILDRSQISPALLSEELLEKYGLNAELKRNRFLVTQVILTKSKQ